jgi:hypothetical protein
MYPSFDPIEFIEKSRGPIKDKKKLQFLVHWIDSDEPTWEPCEHLVRHCLSLGSFPLLLSLFFITFHFLIRVDRANVLWNHLTKPFIWMILAKAIESKCTTVVGVGIQNPHCRTVVHSCSNFIHNHLQLKSELSASH